MGPGAVAEALQCKAKADEARADGEAELEQKAEQEVVLGLREEGRPVTAALYLDSRGCSVNRQARGWGGRQEQGRCPGEDLPSSVPAPPPPAVGGGHSDGSPPILITPFPKTQPSPLPATLNSSGKAQAHRLHFAYLLGNGLKVFPCCHRHDGAMGGLPQQRDAEKQRRGERRRL